MQPIIEHFAQEIRQIYEDDPQAAKEAIDTYLKMQLEGLDINAQKQIVQLLQTLFPLPPPPPAHEKDAGQAVEQEALARFCSLILGKTVSPADLNSPEILDRLSKSLNTIFDTLNTLVASIRTTLYTENTGKETIRHMIGSSLTNGEARVTLEEYLGEIRTAFFVSHQAFQAAAMETIDSILQELDPDHIAKEEKGGFAFGVLKKAQVLERYQQVYANCKKWHVSGRSMDVFLKDFEKHCRDFPKRPRR